MAELRDVNCIDAAGQLTIGRTLFVPRPPRALVMTSVPVEVTPGREPDVSECVNPDVQIAEPVAFQMIEGKFMVRGTAFIDDFWYYRLEIRPEWSDMYVVYQDFEQSVLDGDLGEIDSDLFDTGLHRLRLSVINRAGGIASRAICEIPVVFR